MPATKGLWREKCHSDVKFHVNYTSASRYLLYRYKQIGPRQVMRSHLAIHNWYIRAFTTQRSIRKWPRMYLSSAKFRQLMSVGVWHCLQVETDLILYVYAGGLLNLLSRKEFTKNRFIPQLYLWWNRGQVKQLVTWEHCFSSVFQLQNKEMVKPAYTLSSNTTPFLLA